MSLTAALNLIAESNISKVEFHRVLTSRARRPELVLQRSCTSWRHIGRSLVEECMIAYESFRIYMIGEYSICPIRTSNSLLVVPW
jgi:hypothetical protein